MIKAYGKWEISGQDWIRTNNVKVLNTNSALPLSYLPICLVRAPGIEPEPLAPRRRFTNKLMDVS